jgi:hypothetical protein
MYQLHKYAVFCYSDTTPIHNKLVNLQLLLYHVRKKFMLVKIDWPSYTNYSTKMCSQLILKALGFMWSISIL